MDRPYLGNCNKLNIFCNAVSGVLPVSFINMFWGRARPPQWPQEPLQSSQSKLNELIVALVFKQTVSYIWVPRWSWINDIMSFGNAQLNFLKRGLFLKIRIKSSNVHCVYALSIWRPLPYLTMACQKHYEDLFW